MKQESKSMSREEAAKLFYQWKAGECPDFPELVVKQLHDFVWNICWEYPTYIEKGHANDMYQEGMMAILSRLPDWNPNYALATYFTPIVKGQIHAYLAEQVHRVNKNDVSKNRRIMKAAAYLKSKDIPVTIENIVRCIGDPVNFTREVVAKNLDVMAKSQSMIHLEEAEKKGDNNHMSLLDLFQQDTMTPEAAYEEKEKQEIVQQALSKLTPEERETMISLFVDENTIKDTALRLGVNETKIKRIRTSALNKMKRSPILRTYLGLTDVEESSEIAFIEFDNFQDFKDDEEELYVFVS